MFISLFDKFYTSNWYDNEVYSFFILHVGSNPFVNLFVIFCGCPLHVLAVCLYILVLWLMPYISRS